MRARTRVMLPVIKHREALPASNIISCLLINAFARNSPSHITMAARSAVRVISVHSPVDNTCCYRTLGVQHQSLTNALESNAVPFRFDQGELAMQLHVNGMVLPTLWPRWLTRVTPAIAEPCTLTCLFSSTFLPLTRSAQPSVSNSTSSTCTHRVIRIFWLSTDPVVLSLLTFLIQQPLSNQIRSATKQGMLEIPQGGCSDAVANADEVVCVPHVFVELWQQCYLPSSIPQDGVPQHFHAA